LKTIAHASPWWCSAAGRGDILGMIQRMTASDPVPEQFVSAVLAVVDPWRIVLFGSRARGDWKERSDYDFYVEVDVEREQLEAIQRRIREALPPLGRSVDVTVHCRGAIERRRDDPGTLEWDVAREGVLLYAHRLAPDAIRPTARVKEGPVPESVHEWLASADQNRRLCEHTRATAAHEFSSHECWLSHQVVEKYLKALLVSRGVRPERTHHLVELLATARSHGVMLEGIAGKCKLLNDHAVDARYTKGLDLGPDEADAAYGAMVRVVEEIRRHLPPRLH
jgi:HEPN domain-containing protein/predicted nucleotidyltransferase